MPYINIHTPIPGPKSREVLARRAAAVTQGVARATDVVVVSGKGALVTDADGNTLIDMAGGIGMLGVGHCPPTVVEAIQRQAAELLHTCSIVATYETYVELAEMLNAAAPGDFAKKTLLANSGSEAVENAVKIARAFTGRPGVIVFEGAYHGRTNLTLAMTSKYGLFKKGFGPYAPEVYRLPIPNLYRRPAGMTESEYLDYSIVQLENAMIAQIDPSAVACIVIEPVQGEAGFLPVPPRFLERIRTLCTQHGIVMVADEIQSGMGRTGRLFAIEHYGIVPDLITTGKSLGAGMPIAALTGRADIMDAPHPGGVGGTYGGAPVACVAAIEAVKMIRSAEFIEAAARTERVMLEMLGPWKERYPLVGDVRGLGPMRLVEFVSDRDKRTPAPNETLAIIRQGVQNGLILIRAGLYSNCIRLMPPINIPEDQLREALGALEAAVKVVHERMLQHA